MIRKLLLDCFREVLLENLSDDNQYLLDCACSDMFFFSSESYALHVIGGQLFAWMFWRVLINAVTCWTGCRGM